MEENVSLEICGGIVQLWVHSFFFLMLTVIMSFSWKEHLKERPG